MNTATATRSALAQRFERVTTLASITESGEVPIWTGTLLELWDANPDIPYAEMNVAAVALDDDGFHIIDLGAGGRHILRYLSETPAFLTEPTDQGNQYVIPGCEHDRSRGPSQMDMFR